MLSHEERKKCKEEKDEEPSRKFTVKDLVESCAEVNKFFKKFINIELNTKIFSLVERTDHSALFTSRFMTKNETNQANQHGHVQKNGTSSRRTSEGPSEATQEKAL